MLPSVASAWPRISTSMLLMATALVGGSLAASPAQAAPMSVNCSTLVGSVSTDDSFNAAIAKVDLGLCNIITITNSIYLATQKTIDADRVPSLTITGNPDDSTLTSAPRQGIVIKTDDTPVNTNLTLTVSNLTFSGFDDSVGTASALTAESLAGLNVVLTNVSFINNFGGDAPGAANLSAGGSANITINGYSRFQGNRSRYALGGAVRIGAGTGSTVTIGSPGDDSVSFLSNTSMNQSGGAIAVTGSGTNHQLTTHGGTFTDDSASHAGGSINTVGSATFNNTDFTSNTASSGAGGAIQVAGSVVVNGGTFDGNRANQVAATGGAVSAGGGITPSQITNATFVNNSAGFRGGAVRTGGQLTVSGSTFRDDSAGQGGAIAADDTITITDSLFQDDTSTQSGGAVISVYHSVLSQGSTYRANTSGANGGAISAPRLITSTDDSFIGNHATLDGGALSGGEVITTRINFTDNHAARDGGAVGTGSLDDSSSEFIGNRSGQRGGATYLGDPSGQSMITGSTFRDDSSITSGGAIHSLGSLTVADSLFEDDTTGGPGGAIYVGGNLSISNSDFLGNLSLTDAGAIVVFGSASIADSRFERNETRGPINLSQGLGGAIRFHGTASVSGSSFVSNTASGEGGAISAAATLTLEDDTFTLNRALDGVGGAVSVDGASVTVTQSRLTGNTSTRDGGAIRIDGTVTIDSSTFTNNRTTTSGKNGGAVLATGNVSVTSSEFVGNSSTQWGGAISTDGAATVADSTFEANTTSSSGGALRIATTGTITRSTFTDDTSGSEGGAIAVRDLVMHSSSFQDNQAALNGGAVFVVRSGDITNSTFVDNYGGFGGALGFGDPTAASRVVYSTLVGNTAPATQGTAINAPNTTPISLIGSVLAGASPLCRDEGNASHLNLTTTSSYSFATDTSCSGGGAPTASTSINTMYTTDDSLGVASTITTDDTPGWQVVIPDDTAVVNAYVPLSTLPSITTDQLNGLRNSPNGLTSAGAVQVRPTSMTGPASLTVAPGGNATFSVTGYPGIGPTITYQWQRSTNGTSWSNVPGTQTSTLTIPSVTASDSGLQVRVLAFDAYGNDDTSATATLTVSTGPPAGDTPSAPGTPEAAAGEERATVTWTAPISSGSFPVTTYQVRNHVDAKSCLVPASTLECTLSGLSHDRAYRFAVRALNGVGWGPWSAWSEAITPQGPPTITIVGSREGRVVVVAGTTTGLANATVRAMVRLPGQATYSAGATRPIDRDGTFTWQRRTTKKVYVYFTHGDVRSNRVVIPVRDD